MTPETKKLLEVSRERLSDPKLWTKGCGPMNSDGPLCMLDTLSITMTGLHLDWTSYTEAQGFIRNIVEAKGFADVIPFNDHPETSHAMVLEVFDEALANDVA